MTLDQNNVFGYVLNKLYLPTTNSMETRLRVRFNFFRHELERTFTELQTSQLQKIVKTLQTCEARAKFSSIYTSYCLHSDVAAEQSSVKRK